MLGPLAVRGDIRLATPPQHLPKSRPAKGRQPGCKQAGNTDSGPRFGKHVTTVISSKKQAQQRTGYHHERAPATIQCTSATRVIRRAVHQHRATFGPLHHVQIKLFNLTIFLEGGRWEEGQDNTATPPYTNGKLRTY